MIKQKLEQNKNYIVDKYLSGDSTCKLGKEFNCSNAMIYKFLKANNIELRVGPPDYQNNPIIVDKAIELFNENLSCNEIATRLNISIQTVIRLLEKRGFDTKRFSCQRDDPLANHVQEIIDIYVKLEKSTCEISRMFKTQDSAIMRLLRKNGVVLRPLRQYTVNEQFFEKIDTQEKAYVLGFLFADGCNQRNGSIQLSIIDLEILEKIKTAMNFEGVTRIIKPKIKSRKIQYCICIGCRKMSNDLIKLGCVHNKTYFASFPKEEQVPNYLINHFIRGLNDGDGIITKNSKKNVWTTRIVGTKMICEGLSKTTNKHINIPGCVCPLHVSPNHTTYGFTIGGKNQILKYLNWLYKDATIYMERKYQKYLEFKHEMGNL